VNFCSSSFWPRQFAALRPNSRPAIGTRAKPPADHDRGSNSSISFASAAPSAHACNTRIQSRVLFLSGQFSWRFQDDKFNTVQKIEFLKYPKHLNANSQMDPKNGKTRKNTSEKLSLKN
jgi:hypothetical protein